MANDFLPFAADLAANVMTQADYSNVTFTPRLLGFSTGTALSVQLNKVWRQSSLITSTIGQFIDVQTGLGAVDDGTPSGMTALLTNFTTAVTNVARGAVGTGYLPLTGGTLTGNLTINAGGLSIHAPAGQYAQLAMTRPTGQASQIYSGRADGALRWNMQLASAEPEQGGNTGSNFFLHRYDDAGNYLGAPFSINRASGAVNFTATPLVNGSPMNFLPISGGTLTNVLAINGAGIRYNSFGGNFHAFNWDGPNSLVNMFVDSSYVGGIATRAYVGSVAGNYLPLSGGTVWGNTSFTGFVWHVQGGFSSSCYFANAGDFINFGDGRWRYRQWAGNWHDSWDGNTGNRQWYTPSGRTMFLDGNANFSVSGNMVCVGGRVVSQGNGFSPSVSAWNIQGGSCMGFWTDPGYMWFGNHDGAGNPSQGLMFLRNDGYLQVYNSFYCTSQINAAGSIVAGGYLYSASGGVVITGNGIAYVNVGGGSNWAFRHVGGGQICRWLDGGEQELIQGDNSYRVRWLGMSGGSMHWNDSDGSGWYANTFRSDARFKRNIEPAGDFDSLAAICATPTHAFDWIEAYGLPRVPYGMLSTDVRETLPDAVMAAPSEGDQPPVDHLDPMALFAHVFRAIGQLNTKIEMMESAHA